MAFCKDDFVELITRFKAGGYTFRRFTDPVAQRTVVLRHDIDFSVEYAVEMAELEARLGVVATYFFMLTGHAYNLLHKDSRRAVSAIRAMGHSVSLHFDPTVHEDVVAGFEEEKSAIEPITGPLSVVSIHRPGEFLTNGRSLSVPHTYEKRYFEELKYISDSGGAFSYGYPTDDAAFAEGKPMHVLIHPIWWIAPGETASDVLRSWQAGHFAFLNAETSRNCRTFDGRGIVESIGTGAA